jgi:hypothetical protein
VGPRVGLDDVGRRRTLRLPGLELLHSTFQPVASLYIDSATTDPAKLEEVLYKVSETDDLRYALQELTQFHCSHKVNRNDLALKLSPLLRNLKSLGSVPDPATLNELLVPKRNVCVDLRFTWPPL